MEQVLESVTVGRRFMPHNRMDKLIYKCEIFAKEKFLQAQLEVKVIYVDNDLVNIK